jgi:cytochrome c oxidase assembly factor CtaG/ferredoxin
VRGWWVLRHRDPGRWHGGHVAAFLSGLTVVYLALASPIEPLSDLLLQVHMLQHLLLMMVAPPLLWLGAPFFPLLRGLPRTIRMVWVAPLLSAPPLRRLFQRLTHPLTALVLFTAATWFWHVPVVYDLALRSSGWHYLQHICFLSTALLFWYPVIRPYPARPRWSLWWLVPVLLLADLSNTLLSALLTFSTHVLYRYYAEMPRLGGLSALEDQSAAGVLMWVPGSVVFLVPLFGTGVRLLSGTPSLQRAERPKLGTQSAQRFSLPVVASQPLRRTGFDLLRIPVLGRFLRWRHARLCLQTVSLMLAAVVIYDGFRGPQVGAMNLAGVLPWIHWRGLTIMLLLVAGNFFCMGCPFMLPRSLARRWLPARWNWPRRLRNKWPAVLLIIMFLWAYEAYALWDRPLWTAWIMLGYFIAAFVIDGVFRGAAFCKYVCPIGQFNFVQSLASPLEVKVRDPAVCESCHTKDCIRGRSPHPHPFSTKGRGVQDALRSPGGRGQGEGGCELHLYLPRKSSNMDCTTCLDCVHACPHDNVGLMATTPLSELWHDRQRSGVGRFSRRPDLVALILVLVFGAFANASGMVGPVVEWQERMATILGFGSPYLMTAAFYLIGLIVAPAVAIGSAATIGRRWGRVQLSTLQVAMRYAYALVPLGIAMWLAHYSFHLVTSYDAVIPTTQRFLGDLGWSSVGEPQWVSSCCRLPVPWLPRLEIVFLDLGLLFSLYAAYRIAQSGSTRFSQTVRTLAPWFVLITLLFMLGVWLVLQPMQMRGTLGS